MATALPGQSRPDQGSTPDLPRAVLSIRRDMTEAELEDARQRARESDIFPVPQGTVTEQ